MSVTFLVLLPHFSGRGLWFHCLNLQRGRHVCAIRLSHHTSAQILWRVWLASVVPPPSMRLASVVPPLLARLASVMPPLLSSLATVVPPFSTRLASLLPPLTARLASVVSPLSARCSDTGCFQNHQWQVDWSLGLICDAASYINSKVVCWWLQSLLLPCLWF